MNNIKILRQAQPVFPRTIVFMKPVNEANIKAIPPVRRAHGFLRNQAIPDGRDNNPAIPYKATAKDGMVIEFGKMNKYGFFLMKMFKPITSTPLKKSDTISITIKAPGGALIQRGGGTGPVKPRQPGLM